VPDVSVYAIANFRTDEHTNSNTNLTDVCTKCCTHCAEVSRRRRPTRVRLSDCEHAWWVRCSIHCPALPSALRRVHKLPFGVAVCSALGRTECYTDICSHAGSNLSDSFTYECTNGITESCADSLSDCGPILPRRPRRRRRVRRSDRKSYAWRVWRSDHRSKLPSALQHVHQLPFSGAVRCANSRADCTNSCPNRDAIGRAYICANFLSDCYPNSQSYSCANGNPLCSTVVSTHVYSNCRPHC
jgi:hypothetical protein